MPSAEPPIVLLEGSYQRIFWSLDELIGWVEATDVRDGVYTAIDRDGRVAALAAESDTAPVRAVVTDEMSGDTLEQALREMVAENPGRWGLIDADVGVEALLGAVWRTEFPNRPFPK